MRLAVVDFGSNTIRMTVYEKNNGDYRYILSEKEIIGLVNYTQKGHLEEDGILRIIETMKSFSETATAIQTDHLGCFATAGLRSIKNAEEVVERVSAETGIKIMTISGEEEARLDFIGAWRPQGLEEGLVIDMGGGSTELVRFKDGTIEKSISLPFGSLILYRRFVKKILPTEKEIKKIKRFVEKQISLVDWLPGSAGHACLIGGTIRAIARLHREFYHREKEGLQGYTFDAPMVSAMLKNIDSLGDDGAKLLTRVAPERIHTILPGMAAYSQILKAVGCQTISISRSGVREGYLKEMEFRLGLSENFKI